MSEYTPITTDMRLLLGCFTKLTDFERDKFTQLCDAIDSIHAELERENERLRCELDERPIAVGPDALEAMARLEHSVELPKDADGEYIYADDDVEWLNGIKHGRVTGIGVGERDGWIWVLMDGKNVSIALLAIDLHHCCPDTWESIIHDAMQTGRTDTAVDVTPLIERCKALCERSKEGDAE